MLNSVKKFLKSKRGNISMIVALAAVPLLGSVALGVDYAVLFLKKSELQDSADSTALAAVKELVLANASDQDINNLSTNIANANVDIGQTDKLSVLAKVGTDRKSVDVTLSYVWQPFLAHYLDPTALPIVAKSQASLANKQSSICVLALDAYSHASVDLGGKATMTANGCSVVSNSTSSAGISVSSKSKVTGASIQSAGGIQGPEFSFSPKPIVDTPQISDPLASRVAPAYGGCDHNNFSTVKDATLYPGTYCGGLNVGGKAIAKLEPGVYVIKDSPLTITGNGSIVGENVGFYFTGPNATMDFGVSTQVNITAPKSGPMAGLLFFEDRNSSANRNFTIRSKDAERMEGMIYLPKGRLWIDKASRVGQLSNWTAIVANKIALGNGPNIVINSDYANSDIPLPTGFSSKGKVRLIK